MEENENEKHTMYKENIAIFAKQDKGDTKSIRFIIIFHLHQDSRTRGINRFLCAHKRKRNNTKQITQKNTLGVLCMNVL
jgi:hypothetical protein